MTSPLRKRPVHIVRQEDAARRLTGHNVSEETVRLLPIGMGLAGIATIPEFQHRILLTVP
jgi:hypothetical protein